MFSPLGLADTSGLCYLMKMNFIYFNKCTVVKFRISLKDSCSHGVSQHPDEGFTKHSDYFSTFFFPTLKASVFALRVFTSVFPSDVAFTSDARFEVHRRGGGERPGGV